MMMLFFEILTIQRVLKKDIWAELWRRESAFHLASLAQLVEQMTLNHWVAGSSPAGSTNSIIKPSHIEAAFFGLYLTSPHQIFTN